MIEYKLTREKAHIIAVGIYRDIGYYITTVKPDKHEDYERFASEYKEKDRKQTIVSVKT